MTGSDYRIQQANLILTKTTSSSRPPIPAIFPPKNTRKSKGAKKENQTKKIYQEMAIPFLSTAKSFLCSTSTPSSPSSSLKNSPTTLFGTQHKQYNAKRQQQQQLSLCKACTESPSSSPPSSPSFSIKRRSLSVAFIASLTFSLAGRGNSRTANAAILEADDDVELLERVKKDRQKRIERQGAINSASKEKGYLQDVVYKLSKVGQAIDNNDLSAASSELGGSTNTDWVQRANQAFTKLSSSPEEKTQVDTFNSSLASLISSVLDLCYATSVDNFPFAVTSKDIKSSKTAFVSSATAFEEWTNLTGLVSELKGL
ncbi:hypothetical protein Tsubulata_007761 [Turnera subulata]|uniref:Maintenance of Photosystem II under High light 2 C-terminal domain-containing protein n=1 Tax=Turnera subulata TaxID=218843 RepID=A0A9Q0FYU4_9ROSI|nr:hypothetical protein Tsubulata_007761 [Turnera subulata]